MLFHTLSNHFFEVNKWLSAAAVIINEAGPTDLKPDSNNHVLMKGL